MLFEKRKKERAFAHIVSRLYTVLGIVLVWRAIWYILDELDKWLFGGSHLEISIMSLVLGVILLFVPDWDLKEIEKI